MQKAKKPQSLPTPHQKPQQFLKHQSTPKVTPKHRQNKVKFFKPKSTFKFHSKVIRPFCCLAGAAASLRVSSIMSPTPLYTHSCFGSSATMLLFDFEMAMQDLNLTSLVHGQIGPTTTHHHNHHHHLTDRLPYMHNVLPFVVHDIANATNIGWCHPMYQIYFH